MILFVCLSMAGQTPPSVLSIRTGATLGNMGHIREDCLSKYLLSKLIKLWLQFLYFAQYAMFENQIVANHSCKYNKSLLSLTSYLVVYL